MRSASSRRNTIATRPVAASADTAEPIAKPRSTARRFGAAGLLAAAALFDALTQRGGRGVAHVSFRNGLADRFDSAEKRRRSAGIPQMVFDLARAQRRVRRRSVREAEFQPRRRLFFAPVPPAMPTVAWRGRARDGTSRCQRALRPFRRSRDKKGFASPADKGLRKRFGERRHQSPDRAGVQRLDDLCFWRVLRFTPERRLFGLLGKFIAAGSARWRGGQIGGSMRGSRTATA